MKKGWIFLLCACLSLRLSHGGGISRLGSRGLFWLFPWSRHSSSSSKIPLDHGLDNAQKKHEFVSRTKLTGDASTWKGRHFISVAQLDSSGIELVMSKAQEMRVLVESKGGDDRLKGKVLGCVFYEPSTRTSSSMQAAMIRLGGTYIRLEKETSSIQKGESFLDTLQCFSVYCDVVALRHAQEGSSLHAVLEQQAETPIINAGDGPDEHPTQALLDLFTIKSELGRVQGLKIAFVGDLLNSRTIHSLLGLLRHYDWLELHYVAPDSLQIPQKYIDDLNKPGISQYRHSDLESIISAIDVLYMTRIQKERFLSLREYDLFKNLYRVDLSSLARAKPDMIVMHPLPRVNEISMDVDDDPRAAYFRQMKYGMYMRMAILCLILE